MALKPGDILRDKYRIDALIGRGGMGHVFGATDLHSREQVAVKVVSRVNVDDVLLVRLHREAEAAERIQSDYIPRVVEVSETDEGETFFAMERLFGVSLSHRIRKGGPIEWNEVYRIGEDILHGLIDAHRAGVVHRDLKPSNLFLARREAACDPRGTPSGIRAMILDFGVCKMSGIDTERLTGTGESIGTVAYMAPEQVRGAARVDERADLFAFGVLIFEMLTGRLPHEGPSQMAILANKLERDPLRLSEFARVPIPEGTDEFVMRAIQRDPDHRFGSAQEMLEAWRVLGQTDALVPNAVEPEQAAVDAAESEAPTEISGPGADLIALSAAQSVADVGAEAGGDTDHGHASGRGLPKDDAVPVDIHPTQTALSTHYTSVHRRTGVVRGALLLACAALVGGITVVAVTVTRGPGVSGESAAAEVAPVESAASAVSSVIVAPAVAPEASAVPEAPQAVEVVEDAGGLEAPTIELRSDEGTHRGGRGRGRSHGTPAPKPNGQRITEKPRF